MEHHTCFAGLSTPLLHQLSLAADLSPRGGPMPYVSVLQVLNCLALLVFASLHSFSTCLSFGRLSAQILFESCCCLHGFFFLLS